MGSITYSGRGNPTGTHASCPQAKVLFPCTVLFLFLFFSVFTFLSSWSYKNFRYVNFLTPAVSSALDFNVWRSEQGREGSPLPPLGSWQGQRKLELADSQDFPWKYGDSGWQRTTDGPDLPWLPEWGELETIQKAPSLRATGHSSSHPKSLPQGSGFAGPPVVFAQFLSQDRVRFCFEAQYVAMARVCQCSVYAQKEMFAD